MLFLFLTGCSPVESTPENKVVAANNNSVIVTRKTAKTIPGSESAINKETIYAGWKDAGMGAAMGFLYGLGGWGQMATSLVNLPINCLV